MIGRTLSHYRIIEQIGSGGMGVVYRARDERLDRDVAIKVLPIGTMADDESRRRFRREALTLSKLNHPHIATIYDFDTHDGIDFLVMEYVAGMSLDERLSKGSLPEKEALRLGIQLAQGLSAAHAAGIIHRDLKPGNLRVTPDSRIKILDFGLAKTLHSTPLDTTVTATEAGLVAGTLPYMPPEQLRGEQPDARSDIYSAGLVLYEAATGKRAFPQSQAAQLMDAILHEVPLPPKHLNPQLSPALDGIIVKAIDKDPNLRYQAARELEVDLERLVAPALHTREARERTMLRLWTLAATGAFIAILALALLRFSRSERPATIPSQRQITYLGNVGACALSPDGRTIAYAIPDSIGSTREKVVVQDIAGGAPLTVLRIGDCSRLIWSPNGAEILAIGGPLTAYRIYVVPRLGGQTRHYDRNVIGAAWSPDGTQIAMVFRLKRIQIVEKASGDYSKFLPVRGTFTRLLDVDWCPVGDRLLVETSDSLQRITLWTISTRGENQQRVLQDSVMLEGATWSARGDAIDYFRQSQGQGAALWKVRIDPKRGTPTGRPRLLLDGLRVDAGSISREGGRLACTRSLEYSNLWRLNWKLDTRSPKRWQMEPMTSGTAVNESPSVSPMGDRVVFVREGAEGSDLWTASIRGGDAYQLTHGIRSVASPVWSPDGSKIAFAGEQGGALRVWVVGADGLRSRCYSQTLLDADWSLTWSRTKGVLYVGLGHRRIDGLDPVTGGTRTFIPEGALQWVYSPKVSPDGNRVVLSTSHHGLCVVDAADPTKLLLCTPTVALPFGWDSTGRTIFAFIPPSPRILEISAESGVVVPLPEPGVPAGMKVSTLSAAPDGRTFIYALSQSVSDVVLVEGFDPDAR